MLDAINQNLLVPIVDFEKNPVVTAADTVGILRGQFLYPERARIICEMGNARGYSLNLLPGKGIEVSLRRGFKNDLECHAS